MLVGTWGGIIGFLMESLGPVADRRSQCSAHEASASDQSPVNPSTPLSLSPLK